MTVTRKIRGPRGSKFWNSLQVDDCEMLRVMIKEEFQRPEAASDIHCITSREFEASPSKADASNAGAGKPNNMIISLPCLENCLVSLYRGAIHLQGEMGSSPFSSTGHAYAIKDEEYLGLERDTDIFIMEQENMRGVCAGRQEEIAEEERCKQLAEERERHRRALERRLREEAEERRSRPPIRRKGKVKEKAWDTFVRKIKREPTPEPEDDRVQCAAQ